MFLKPISVSVCECVCEEGPLPFPLTQTLTSLADLWNEAKERPVSMMEP